MADGSVAARVYATDGTLLASGTSADGVLNIDLNGYNGIVVVTATAQGNTATAKVVVR